MNQQTIDSEKVQLSRGCDGQLRVTRGARTSEVWIARCFPWSSRATFISLRDKDRREIWLVDDPANLDESSRQALEAALVEADFVLEVVQIHSVEEEIEIRCWDVTTRQGKRRFQTRRDDWPRVMPGGGILIRDVSDDLYHVSKPERLDRDSRRLLDVFVD